MRQPDDDLHYPIFVKAHTVRAFIEQLAIVTQIDAHKIERVINRRKSASTQGKIGFTNTFTALYFMHAISTITTLHFSKIVVTLLELQITVLNYFIVIF